jgi:hypothetical protein
METTARSRFGVLPLLAVAGVAAGLTTFALVYLMDTMTPPCGGPFCFFALVWMPVSGLGAAIVALLVGKLARRGARGYALALLAGAAGYLVAWQILSGGLLLQF